MIARWEIRSHMNSNKTIDTAANIVTDLLLNSTIYENCYVTASSVKEIPLALEGFDLGGKLPCSSSR